MSLGGGYPLINQIHEQDNHLVCSILCPSEFSIRIICLLSFENSFWIKIDVQHTYFHFSSHNSNTLVVRLCLNTNYTDSICSSFPIHVFALSNPFQIMTNILPKSQWHKCYKSVALLIPSTIDDCKGHIVGFEGTMACAGGQITAIRSPWKSAMIGALSEPTLY